MGGGGEVLRGARGKEDFFSLYWGGGGGGMWGGGVEGAIESFHIMCRKPDVSVEELK